MVLDVTTSQFLALLRSGLWGAPVDLSLFENGADWEAIFNMAEKQTVRAVVFDGVLSLPQNYHPRIDLFMDWLGQVNIIEVNNRDLNNGVREVLSRYNAAGLSPILLKGQGVGQYYRHPEHRQPGDIDLYFSEGFDEANRIAASWDNVLFHPDTDSHRSFSWNGWEVENHRKYVKMVSRKNELAWQEVENMTMEGVQERYQVGDVVVPLLNPQTNVLYIFLHLQHHLLQVGVGLRQVCDWLCLWQARGKVVDRDLFLQCVDRLPVRRCMTALAWIGENHLGLERGIIPLDTTTSEAREDGELLLQDILETGNFGQDTVIWKGFKKNHHIHNIRSYYLAAKRMIRIHRLCPSELNAYPWNWLKSKFKPANWD